MSNQSSSNEVTAENISESDELSDAELELVNGGAEAGVGAGMAAGNVLGATFGGIGAGLSKGK